MPDKTWFGMKVFPNKESLRAAGRTSGPYLDARGRIRYLYQGSGTTSNKKAVLSPKTKKKSPRARNSKRANNTAAMKKIERQFPLALKHVSKNVFRHKITKRLFVLQRLKKS